MNPEYTTVRAVAPSYNMFDMSYVHNTSGRFGQLMPLFLDETVPGDIHRLTADTFLRFAPLAAPVMHRFDVYVHYFNVPMRLVWPKQGANGGWVSFIVPNQTTGGRPYITIDGTETPDQVRLLDYLGIPPHPGAPAAPMEINAMPLAAYQMIWNEYYRNQRIVDEIDPTLEDGDNNVKKSLLLTLRNRCWEKDMFTSALPTPQLGSPVDIPLGTVELRSNWEGLGTIPAFVDQFGNIPDTGRFFQTGSHIIGEDPIPPGQTDPMAYDPKGSLTVGATTIKDLREAEALQKYLERVNVIGSRFNEYLKGIYNVDYSDKTLQRPQYITGTQAPVIINEVTNMANFTGEAPQGTQTGQAISVGQGYLGKYYCEEQSYVLGIMSVMPKTQYQQGISRLWTREDNLEFANAMFAHIGEQEIKVKEIYAYDVDSDEVFGYVPRFSEYKSRQNQTSGQMRDILDVWTATRVFNNSPTLSQEFIECSPDDLTFIFNLVDPTDDYLYINVHNKAKVLRKLPTFSTPMLT